MGNRKKNNKGFTMVELIIVIALMAIIGAALVPAFGGMSARARLSTDLSTAKTLRRLIQTYKAQEGHTPLSINASGGPISQINTNNFAENAIDELKKVGLLDEDITWQTQGLKLSYNNIEGYIKLNLSGITGDDDIIRAYNSLAEDNPNYFSVAPTKGDSEIEVDTISDVKY